MNSKFAIRHKNESFKLIDEYTAVEVLEISYSTAIKINLKVI